MAYSLYVRDTANMGKDVLSDGARLTFSVITKDNSISQLQIKKEKNLLEYYL